MLCTFHTQSLQISFHFLHHAHTHQRVFPPCHVSKHFIDKCLFAVGCWAPSGRVINVHAHVICLPHCPNLPGFHSRPASIISLLGPSRSQGIIYRIRLKNDPHRLNYRYLPPEARDRLSVFIIPLAENTFIFFSHRDGNRPATLCWSASVISLSLSVSLYCSITLLAVSL